MKDDQNERRTKWKTTKMEYDQNGRRPKWKTTKMEDDLIDVGDCGWRVNQTGNSAIPRFRDFYTCSPFLVVQTVFLFQMYTPVRKNFYETYLSEM